MSDNLITEVDICDEAKDNFLTYAEEVLTDRAIPNVEDGLLSVHRKILWTMEECLKMTTKSKYKKSASIVGSTLSTSYGHGDAACYGALCKIAQPYLMRYPLVMSDGNIGSQERNGTEASPRYTNAKPTKYADLMFENFKKNPVPLKLTYNEEYEEPVYLPSLLPNALINGGTWIAIGMSHSSLPHNLTEVCNGILAYLNNRGLTLDELMEYIPGPDFPLGGVVINQADVKENFAKGNAKGKTIKVRGDYEIEGNKIIFTSIPYRTYRNQIKKQISDKVDELSKYIKDFDDESNLGKNRLVFEVANGVDPKTAVNKLFALTDLQTTVSYNMNYIVNGTPKLLGMLDLIKEYVNHQNNVLIKVAKYDLKKAEDRVHILKGLLLAVDKIDEVIKLIKGSKNKAEAQTELIKFLKIDEVQADSILKMQLGRLTRINKDELVQEKKDKEKEIADCKMIIYDPEYRNKVLIKKVKEMKMNYGDERRTKLVNIEDTTKPQKAKKEIIIEDVTIEVTGDNKIKRCSTNSYMASRTKTLGGPVMVLDTKTDDKIIAVTSAGKAYPIPVSTIPEGTESIYTITDIPSNEKILAIYHKDIKEKYIVFVTSNGKVKRMEVSELLTLKKKTGSVVIKLKDDSTVVYAHFADEGMLNLVTKNGLTLCFSLDQIRPSKKMSCGIWGLRPKEGDAIVGAAIVKNKEDALCIITDRGYCKKILKDNLLVKNRDMGGNRVMNSTMLGEIGMVAALRENDVLRIYDGSATKSFKYKDISSLLLDNNGDKLVKNFVKGAITIK